MATVHSDEMAQLRAAVHQFIDERFQAKTEKLTPDDPEYQKLVEQFDHDRWLANAARRVSQLQIVTHSLKPLHPDAKGSSLHAPPQTPADEALIDTNVIGDEFTVDVVGNAAALDVFKFLNTEVDGRTLLARVQELDPALQAAFSDDADTARERMEQFAGITEPGGPHTSHTLAKQLFWLVGEDPTDDAAFHLLAPLYPTSLVHAIHQTINHDRFSDEAKTARQARRDNKPHEHGYNDYPDLAIQRFGGTKPQNISQLNSERRGESYLFSSAPPLWQSRDIAPINARTAFRAFGRRPAVRATVSRLRRAITDSAASGRNNMHMRNRRDRLTGELIDELIVFTHAMRQLEPGWTAAWDCDLPAHQQYWLDPERAETDADFARAMATADWQNAVCGDFSRWLSRQLQWGRRGQTAPPALGDPEYRHFRDQPGERLDFRNAIEIELTDWQQRLDTELAETAEVFSDV